MGNSAPMPALSPSTRLKRSIPSWTPYLKLGLNVVYQGSRDSSSLRSWSISSSEKAMGDPPKGCSTSSGEAKSESMGGMMTV